MLNISPYLYSFIYYHFILLIILFTIYQLNSGKYKGQAKRNSVFIFTLLTLFFIGLRPYNVPGVGHYFGDTINYYHSFLRLSSGEHLKDSNDYGFNLLTRFCAENMSAQAYFFILTVLYILPLYFACKRLSFDYTFLLFLAITASFLFWSSAVNGIRIGIATSFFLLAITFKDKKWLMFLLLMVAISFHKSILLPVIALIISWYYTNSKVYIAIWFASIILSLLFQGFWEIFFASLNLGDKRFDSYLTTKVDATVFAYTGFRWDFLIYSFIPVILGSYYIFKKQYRTELYSQLFNTYLLTNSFWILIIRSNFSNRFASLSWFIIPILLIYPLLKAQIWVKQEANISLILFLSYAFTYFMAFNLLWK